jgi:hypothetical protein
MWITGDSSLEALDLADMALRRRVIPLDFPKYLLGLGRRQSLWRCSSSSRGRVESVSLLEREASLPDPAVVGAGKDECKGEPPLEGLALFWGGD